MSGVIANGRRRHHTATAYDAVARTRPAPIGMLALVAGLVPALLPMLPAAAVPVPIKDVVMNLVGVLL